jgi:uncharacterized Zn finger protein
MKLGNHGDRDRPRKHPMSSQIKIWRCSSCGFILGKSDQDQEEIRLKYHDFFIKVKGGEVTVICTSCGQTNTLKPTKKEEEKK